MAGETPNSELPQTQMQAFTQHLERVIKQQRDGLYERLDQMQQAQQENHGDRRRRSDEGEQRTLRIDGIKLNILTFNGKSDPEAYLEWEIKVEQCSPVVSIMMSKR